MKQKLALSCMLVHSPEVLVLDEPTIGVDPVSRGEFWDILKALRDQGSAVLVSTAYMDEALLCDRVALLFEGRILAEESPGELAGQYGEPLYLVETPVAHRVHAELESSLLCGQCHLFGDGVHVTLRPGGHRDPGGRAPGRQRGAVPATAADRPGTGGPLPEADAGTAAWIGNRRWRCATSRAASGTSSPSTR